MKFSWPWEEPETIWKEEQELEIETHPIVSELAPGVEPYFLDINGDSLVDIMISLKESSKPIQVLIQTVNLDTKKKSFDMKSFDDNFLSKMDICLKPNATRAFTNPHFIHLADLNNDCVTDFFVTTQNKGFKQAEAYMRVLDAST